jgi:predicted nucleic acid-binding Zn ribbon protein
MPGSTPPDWGLPLGIDPETAGIGKLIKMASGEALEFDGSGWQANAHRTEGKQSDNFEKEAETTAGSRGNLPCL